MKIFIGIYIPRLTNYERMVYLVLVIPFTIIGSFLSMISTWVYNLYHVDDFSWLKG
jgi:hypothetical protein